MKNTILKSLAAILLMAGYAQAEIPGHPTGGDVNDTYHHSNPLLASTPVNHNITYGIVAAIRG